MEVSVTMPESMDNTKTDECATRARGQSTFLFWLSVWVGTILAAGVFGFLFDYDGASWAGDRYFDSTHASGVAGNLGAFTVANVAFVTWCFWLSRIRVVMGGLAGSLTVVIFTLSKYDWPPPFDSWNWLVLAGLLGMLGGGLAGHCYHCRARAQGLQQPRHRWRFSLHDVFVRLTIISTLIAIYVSIGDRILAFLT